MCGRYRLSSTERFLEHFNVENELQLTPRFNIAPGQQVAVVRQHRERPVRTVAYMRWGLIPYWSKDDKGSYKMINTRSENVMERPAYAEPFEKRRCLVPADGFYEWQRRGSTKQPFSFGLTDNSLFAFAGIWDRWKSPTGETVESCSILTTKPNVLLADIHDRMPVVLADDCYDFWLDPANRHPHALLDLLQPLDASLMKRYPVSTRVNSVAFDDPECAAEVTLADAAASDTLFPM